MRKQTLKRGILLAVVLLFATLLVPFSSEAATESKISKKKATICVGEKLTLKVTGTGTVKWKTSNKKIASVSKNGVITGKKVGNCTITATKSGVKYTCKVKVKKIPKNYATVNGKKVKVGKTVRLIYSIQSNKPIATISIKYKYDYAALEIVSPPDEKRYPTWECNEYYPECYDDDKSLCDIAHLIGWNGKDWSYWANISCKKAKVVDSMEVKVLKSGNYTMKVDIYSVGDQDGNVVKDFTVSEKIK